MCRLGHMVRVRVALMRPCVMSSDDNGCLSSQEKGHRSPPVKSPDQRRNRFEHKHVESRTKGSDSHFLPNGGDGEMWHSVRPVCLGPIFASPLHFFKWEVFCLATAAYLRGGDLLLSPIFAGLRDFHTPCVSGPWWKDRILCLGEQHEWPLAHSTTESSERTQPAACLPQSKLRIWAPGCWSKKSTQPRLLFIFICDICISASLPH